MPSLSFKNQFELCKTNNSLNSNLGGWRDLKLLYPPPPTPSPAVALAVIIQTRSKL